MSADHLLSMFKEIADHNDWHKKHSPKNLAMAISVEAAELLREFQWLSEEESYNLERELKKQAVSDEVADIFLYLIALCDKLDLDILTIAEQKMLKNQKKFIQSSAS